MSFDAQRLKHDAYLFQQWADSAKQRSEEHREVAQYTLSIAAMKLSTAAQAYMDALMETAHELEGIK